MRLPARSAHLVYHRCSARRGRPGRSVLYFRRMMNQISWVKPDPPPNALQTAFTHAHEPLLWASRGSRHTFNYDLINSPDSASELFSVWRIQTVPKKEKRHGYHPTQKPLRLVRRSLLAPTQERDLGLTLFAALGLLAWPPRSSTASLWERSWRRRSAKEPPGREVLYVRSPAFTQRMVDPDQGTRRRPVNVVKSEPGAVASWRSCPRPRASVRSSIGL